MTVVACGGRPPPSVAGSPTDAEPTGPPKGGRASGATSRADTLTLKGTPLGAKATPPTTASAAGYAVGFVDAAASVGSCTYCTGPSPADVPCDCQVPDRASTAARMAGSWLAPVHEDEVLGAYTSWERSTQIVESSAPAVRADPKAAVPPITSARPIRPRRWRNVQNRTVSPSKELRCLGVRRPQVHRQPPGPTESLG